jgi:uncharacterized protein
MLKLLILVGAVIAIVWLLKRAFAGDRPADAPAQTPQGDLVACARCGVNLPKSEARNSTGAFYCSEEHLRLGPRKP